MLAVSLEMETHYCPNCGKSLNLEHRHGRKANSEEKLYSVVQSFHDMMVVRTFDVLRDNVYGCDTRMYIHEVFQNWITADGKEVITGKNILVVRFISVGITIARQMLSSTTEVLPGITR